jgi:DNA-binding transcriptional LysR family regulator
MIQLQRLEGFYWVATTGGYARAARAFPYPITQPAVHQQVKKLEAEVGVTLFERVSKDRMVLTAAGQRLYEVVRPFYELLPGVVRSLREGDYGGEVFVHTATIFLRHLIPAWIQRVHAKHPRLRIHLSETLQPDLEGLRRGSVDLVVDHLPEVPEDVETIRVATLHPFLVLPRGHPLAGKKRLALAELAADTFIAYSPGLHAHDLQMRALAENGVSPTLVLSASSAESILGFVEAGLGYSIVPSLDASGPKSRMIAVQALSSDLPEFPVYAAWRKDVPENPHLDILLAAAPRE